MKKSYNPFKMWGSWAGLVIIGIFGTFLVMLAGANRVVYGTSPNILGIIVMYLFGLGILIGSFISGSILEGNLSANLFNSLSVPLIIIFQLVYGFLIGWAINSLWRKYR